MAEERVMGSRHSWPRTLSRAGMLSTGPKSFYDLAKKISVEEKVPQKNRIEGLQYLSDLVRAAGVQIDTSDIYDALSEEEPPKELAKDPKEAALEADIGAEIDELDLGFDELEETEEPEGSPLAQFVRSNVSDWLARKKFRFLWRPVEFQGQKFCLISTWRLRYPGLEWNLMGLTRMDGNNVLIHKGGPDILVSEHDNPICINEDFALDWEIPKHFNDSLYAGKTLAVEASVFIWALKYVPNREFRFWLNEERPHVKPPTLPKKDIWKKRVVMKP